MGKEIERKFLVVGDSWRNDSGARIRQGYFRNQIEGTVRVRTKGEHGYLTIKGRTTGISRLEFEYEIPRQDADQILDELCLRPLIEKVRYIVKVGGFEWEVDEFLGENAGLVVAEIELSHEEQAFSRPGWLGKEVSDDTRYQNASLVEHPYRTWKKRG